MEQWNGATASALPAGAAFPEGAFIHLFSGARSPAEREATVPDCWLLTEEDRVLVQMLFPKRPRRRVGDAGSVLSPVFILKHIDVIDDCGEDVQNNECECPGLLCARRQVVIESLARKPLGFSQGLNGRVLSCLTTPCGGWLVVLPSQRTATPPVARRGEGSPRQRERSVLSPARHWRRPRGPVSPPRFSSNGLRGHPLGGLEPLPLP